jgi:F0F1-type ATP synthase assembly protein I
MIEGIKEEIENLLYPELHSYGRSDRDRLLQEARKTPFDFIEWAGILAALVFVVILTRYSAVNFGLADRIAVAAINFLIALLLLGVTAGPFLVRRTRRGLRSQLH